MHTLSPMRVPVMICASMTFSPNRVIVILVPLHSPVLWLMLRRSITGRPTLSLRWWFGIPGCFKVLRNSVGNCSSISWL
uniref:Uncharacterized protein n=1 Tax=Arundo donax TaxID=35708 RepID=A0A0A9A1D4_ARUDO